MSSFTAQRDRIACRGLLAALLILAAWIAGAPPAAAQAYLPSMKIGTASLVTPSAADTYYGAATTSTTTLAARQPELVALSRALKGDPDLIYQYVRNNIQTVWEYGLQKGALGASIDKSGTAFDQAMLMVELLRQAGFTATYEVGTITLTGAQFTAWSDVADATAACQLLSGGGIPAIVNGTTSATCAYGTGTAISTVTLSHAWVKVNIPGASCAANCLFDPAYKSYRWLAGINLFAATGLTAGVPLSTATNMTSGYTTGTDATLHVPFAQTFTAAALGALLQDYSTSLLTYMQTNNLNGLEMEDLVSGGVVVPAPTASLRQTALPYAASVLREWTSGVPDQYRTVLHLTVSMLDPNSGTIQVMFDNVRFFADETYGRRLTIGTNFTNEIHQQPDYATYTTRLKLDDQILSSFTMNSVFPDEHDPATVTLALDHPYAASSGTYMDVTQTKSATLITPISIVLGLGDTSPELLSKWSGERPQDTAGPNRVSPLPDCEFDCILRYLPSTGDYTREKTQASFLAQFTRAAHLHAAIAGGIVQIHHVLGLVYADELADDNNPIRLDLKPDYWVADSATRLDIDTGLSFASRTANAPARRAAVQAIAATSAALEGSVVAQMQDAPDSSSTATRFDWGNAPPCTLLTSNLWHCEDPSQGGPRKFLTFSTAAPPPVTGNWALWENQATVPAGTLNDPNGSPQNFGATERGALQSFVGQYVAAGFSVTASQESFLGPGQRGGYIKVLPPPAHGTIPSYSYNWTRQRGGAFVATKYDANGDPTEIAHDVVGLLATDSAGDILPSKGGGGGSEPGNATTYNPATAADVLKSRFVDRSNALGVNLANGSMSYSTPVLTVGNGGLPYALSAGFAWHQGVGPSNTFGPIKPGPTGGLLPSWYNSLSLSGSGMEGMGASDVRAAAATIAAFLTEQDIYKAAPGTGRDVTAVLTQAWLMRQYQGNVATVMLNGTRQFVRLADDRWIAPGAGYATLTQSGARAPFTFVCPAPFTNSGAQYALARGWDNSGLTFTVTNAAGDQEHFGYWQERNNVNGLTLNPCTRSSGFRLNSWSFPQGMIIALAYDNPEDGGTTGQDGTNQSSSLSAATTFPTGTNLLTIKSIDASGHVYHTLTHGAVGGAFAYTDETGRSLTVDGTLKIIDPAGIATQLNFGAVQTTSPTTRPVFYSQLTQVGTPYLNTGPNPGTLDLQYDYDPLGQVSAVHDAVNLQIGYHTVPGGRDPYAFFIADNTRGERDDPTGAPYTVVYDTYKHPSRYLDEIGRETDAAFDSRGRVTSYTYPEHDQEVMAYDDHNNQTGFVRKAKPGSGLADLTVSAVYDPTWNKPTSITNARGVTTNFTYYASGTTGASEMHTAVRPADGNGHGTATYSFTYTTIGEVDKSTDPDGIVTDNTYDGASNLTATALDPAHINSVTSYTYDTYYNIASTTDPRGFTTTSLYDLDRRKLEDDHHNGNATTALVAASQSVYDAQGRVTDTKAGTAFSGTTVSAWLTTGHTAYTPTSMPATITDADSRTTTTVYDDLDRALTVTDPVGRSVHNAYDAAGQLITEYRGWGSLLQQAYATHVYSLNGKETSVSDANGPAHLTTYTYDGFDRLLKTTYADASHEDLTYDSDGNVLARRNRGSQLLTYTYDLLDRGIAKAIPPSAGPAHTITTAYTAAGRLSSLTDSAGPAISYTLDTAGRATAEAQTILGIARTVSWVLDAMGNHTALIWPDAYAINYTYDALNRMITVAHSGTQLALYTYDPLSRRTSVSYNNGTSSMVYTWTNEGDLLTLKDDFTGGTANDVMFTDTYTNAHQLVSEAVDNGSYVWTPPTPTGHDSYGTVNNLNQYPTVNGGTVTWDRNGNLTAMGGGAYAHDAENRLIAVSGTGPASYTYDPLGRRIAKNVDAHAGPPQWGIPLWGAFTWTANPNTTFLHDGDNEIAEYDNGGALIRRFVPGAAIDEDVAMVTAASVTTFFHTDRKGSVIAMANTSGVRVEGPYTYDSYGNCFVGATTTSCTTLSATAEPYRYTGQRYDAESGLYFYRARYYGPGIGRFYETDPTGYKPDLNWYAYVGNDPTNEADPTGLMRGCFDVDDCFETGARNSQSSHSTGLDAQSVYVKASGQTGLPSILPFPLGGKEVTAGVGVVGDSDGETRIFVTGGIGRGSGDSASIVVGGMNAPASEIDGTRVQVSGTTGGARGGAAEIFAGPRGGAGILRMLKANKTIGETIRSAVAVKGGGVGLSIGTKSYFAGTTHTMSVRASDEIKAMVPWLLLPAIVARIFK